jgi:hypothetical protein
VETKPAHPYDEKTLARFWAKVDKSGGNDACWNWKAGKDGNGFGSFKANGTMIQTHRFAHIVSNGTPPERSCVISKCKNKMCCNPGHLYYSLKHPARPLIDKTGKRFGKLLVLNLDRIDKPEGAFWRCQCDCGAIKIFRTALLKQGRSRSCGCIQTTHKATRGGKRNYIYTTWQSIKARCENPNCDAYSNYGGRGIHLHDPWHDASVFIREVIAEIGERPARHSIDRIDNNGHYEPGNIRWATTKQQCNNKRCNKIITFNGTTKTLEEWADETGHNSARLQRRLDLGWSIEKTLTAPVRPMRPRTKRVPSS